MSRALALAERGWGRVRPNPMVGAIVVREGRVVGEGWHERFGGDHAEIAALRAAGEAARGATLYVTLEPCAHHGKTPPCADAIVEAGVARVVFGASDPHPRAAGGARALAAAGVAVEGPVRASAVRSQNAAFFHRQAGEGPFVALKLALSLDGKLGLRGEETAVTGPEARAAALDLRAGYDAILVGSTTAAVDDPELTARGAIRPRLPPIRAVADTEARLSPQARLLRADAGEAWVFVAEDADPARRGALSATGARVVPLPRGSAGLEPSALLDALEQAGAHAVLCEGGGRLAGSLLSADLVHRLHAFVAPRTFGDDGVPAFPGGAFAPGSPAGWQVSRIVSRGRDVEIAWDRTGGRAGGASPGAAAERGG
ncbi:MAG TPA: bifunctional diaminohydroxyphosphoribosylaminopyrimidine deaminase/5-amino-6-(5-phosphoribosylamino)uracil reductase RibD [Longimicrobiales bacterium]|nr:bifunctional diaminohydroxyphosphoribosylaminopyrimidine deaminase/5-amino-6-(5-phosphoribosylamino)uracil reductase RibD [Longimicrobiales bacterium]